MIISINITPRPSLSNPTDFMPILVRLDEPQPVYLAAFGWRIRLAVWFIRRYVQNCVSESGRAECS